MINTGRRLSTHRIAGALLLGVALFAGSWTTALADKPETSVAGPTASAPPDPDAQEPDAAAPDASAPDASAPDSGASDAAEAPAAITTPVLTVGSTTSDAATKRIIYKDVKLDLPERGFPEILIHQMTLEDADLADAATFKAASVLLEGVTVLVDGRPLLLIDTMRAGGISLPKFDPSVLGLTTSIGNLPPLANWLLAARAEDISIGVLRVGPTAQSGFSDGLLFRNASFANVQGGKIDEFRVEAVRFSAPFGGPFLRARHLDFQALDFRTLAGWLDDKVAAENGPSRRYVFSRFGFDGLAFGGDHATILVDSVQSGSVKLAAAPMQPSSFWDAIGRLSRGSAEGGLAPDEIATLWQSVVTAISIDTLDVNGGKLIAGDQIPSGLDSLHLSGFTGTGLAELRLGNLDITSPDESGATLSLGDLGVHDLHVENTESFFRALADRAGSGGGPKPADLPRLRVASLWVDDFDGFAPNTARLAFKSVRLDTPAWQGFFPTSLALRVDTLTTSALAAVEPSLRQKIAELGLSSVTLNASFDAAWKAADQTLTLGPAALDVERFGRAEASGTIGGVGPALFDDPTLVPTAAITFDIRHAAAALKDGGGLDALLAARIGDATERQAIADEVSKQTQLFMIGTLGLDEAAYQLGSALKAFIAEPKSITVEASSAQPVPVAAILALVQGNAAALSSLRSGIKITASANQAP